MQPVRHATLAILAAGIALVGSYSSSGNEGSSAPSALPDGYLHAYVLTDACTVSIKVQNVHVASTNPYVVKGILTQACDAVNAVWDNEYGTQSGGFGWYFNSYPAVLHAGQTDKDYYYPFVDPLGAYQASPNTGLSYGNAGPIQQNTYRFYVKFDSHISVSGYRSGRVVYVRALVTRFSPNRGLFGGWVSSAGRSVVFYQNRNGWQRFGARATSRNGYTSYVKIYMPGRRLIRATVSATASLWDRTSAPFAR